MPKNGFVEADQIFDAELFFLLWVCLHRQPHQNFAHDERGATVYLHGSRDHHGRRRRRAPAGRRGRHARRRPRQPRLDRAHVPCQKGANEIRKPEMFCLLVAWVGTMYIHPTSTTHPHARRHLSLPFPPRTQGLFSARRRSGAHRRDVTVRFASEGELVEARGWPSHPQIHPSSLIKFNDNEIDL
jgi:hypothetical protein